MMQPRTQKEPENTECSGARPSRCKLIWYLPSIVLVPGITSMVCDSWQPNGYAQTAHVADQYNLGCLLGDIPGIDGRPSHRLCRFALWYQLFHPASLAGACRPDGYTVVTTVTNAWVRACLVLECLSHSRQYSVSLRPLDSRPVSAPDKR